MYSEENNFTIMDNTSEFAKLLNSNWIEPLTIIARVKNYKGIDELILELIKDRLDMFWDTRDNLDDDLQTYFHNTIKGKDVPNEWASNKEEKIENVDSKQDLDIEKQVNEKYHDLKHTDDKEKEVSKYWSGYFQNNIIYGDLCCIIIKFKCYII